VVGEAARDAASAARDAAPGALPSADGALVEDSGATDASSGGEGPPDGAPAADASAGAHTDASSGAQPDAGVLDGALGSDASSRTDSGAGGHRDASLDASSAPHDAGAGAEPDATASDTSSAPPDVGAGAGLDAAAPDAAAPDAAAPDASSAAPDASSAAPDAAPAPDAGSSADGGACLNTELLGPLGVARLMVGFSGDDPVATEAPFDFRYVYLAGGYFDGATPCASCALGCTAGGTSCANAAGGCRWWGCWQWDQVPPGGYARDFVATNQSNRQIPMFTYYQILQASGVAEGAAEVQAAAGVTLMTQYWNDWRFLLQQIGTAVAFLHHEPDFWGYAEQLASDPHALPAAVASANPTDCAGIEDTIAGLGRCVIAMVRKYAPNARVGLHASGWSTGIDVLGNTDPTLDLTAEANKTADYLLAAGGDGADFVVVDYSDRDAGYYQSIGRNTWWDDQNAMLPNFTQALAWSSAIAVRSRKPVIVWQIPVGNRALANTCQHYQDNRVDYLLTHAREVALSNIAGLAFGAGESCQTNPSTDNGNLVAKTNTLDTGGGQSACP
jgi:hypothetical protein